MRRENWIYLFAFLCGVVLVNVLGSRFMVDYQLLNRYSMIMLSFKEISYEVYFVQVLLLRLQTVVGLWILSKVIPKKWLTVAFAAVVCAMLGAIFAMSILANGVWGIWFIVSAMLPHGIFYILAYLLWCRTNSGYIREESSKWSWSVKVLIILLIVIGGICESYISPVFLEKVIKY